MGQAQVSQMVVRPTDLVTSAKRPQDALDVIPVGNNSNVAKNEYRFNDFHDVRISLNPQLRP